jgi:ribose-phosphate pyrophosphokinase
MKELKIFSGRCNPGLARKICEFLNLNLGECTLSTFPDGEFHCKIEDVRGRDVFLIQPTSPPVNDHSDGTADHDRHVASGPAAERITAVIPYFGYARQDRKDEGRVPITAKLVANLITRAGADRVLTMDLHSPQIQGFFDCPVDNLYAAPVLQEWAQALPFAENDRVVVSPDVGSIKRAIGYQKRMGGTLAIVDKRRDSASETRQEHIIGGPIQGKVAFMFDDMITTGGSITGAAKTVHEAGAREIYAAASHGVLCGNAIDKISKSKINILAVTDSIPIPPEKMLPNMKVISVAPLLAEAIKRIHHDQSISAIFSESETTGE